MLPLKTRPAVVIRILSLLALVVALSGPARPAFPGTPEREVRAVWLTTVGALDWPSSHDTARQRSSLIGMIERLSRAGFNTIFFQVRGRGDAVYRPGLEPWSHVLTGTPGTDPGWDPLECAVGEAHARGMEIHAWMNTYLVRGLKSPPDPSKPPHVINAHRDWVRLRGSEWWLDPGEPDVEKYLITVAMDIVSRYDVDGLQMDYIRYPGRSFDDDATYKKFGRGIPRDRWRRDNITRFLTGLKAELDRRTPAVKFGVTPIGIYLNPDGVRGLESFSDVFQDSYEWVRSGVVDYVAPQLYWPVGGDGRDPDFSVMVREWRKETNGRHFYAGIASYKPEVLAQGTRPVEVARDAGADGEAFFRYGSLDGALPLGEIYSKRVLPPAMPWKDNAVPPPPQLVRETTGPGGVPRLTWTIPHAAEQCRFIAVYRGGPGDEERLVAVLPVSAREFVDTMRAGGSAHGSYAVSMVSRSGIESPRAGTATLTASRPGAGPPSAPPVAAEIGVALRVGMPSRARGRQVYFVPFEIGSPGSVRVSVTGTEVGEIMRVFDGDRPAGGYVVSVDMSDFAAGRYSCSILAGPVRIDREILIR